MFNRSYNWAKLPDLQTDLFRDSGVSQIHGLVKGGDRLVVAVSGGPDSVCLLHLLLDIKTELGFDVVVTHLDHQLRPTSADEGAFVSDLAKQLGLPCIIEARDVAAYRCEHRLSLEAAARQVRLPISG